MTKNWNPKYVQYVLEPHFVQAKQHFFAPLLEVSRAHALMLWQVGLLESDHTKKILAALEVVQHEEFAYAQQFEDLFFALEFRLTELAGAEAAGNLHIARSRNDLDAALIRMVLREATLKHCAVLGQLCTILQTRALDGVTWLMPGYTHHQPAQPTTLGHYLCGVLHTLQRDLKRLEAAYQCINCSPLGAVAMTGTGFPINRQAMADWLGFDAVLENATDAVGAADHSLELLGAVQISNVTVSRLLHDLIFWTAQETGFLRVADEFVQISSIMPQKRNPVVLEHIRAKLARSSGAAQSAFGIVGNIPFGDVNDVAEPLLPVTLAALDDSRAALELLGQVIIHSSFDTKKMRLAASQHFITTTGLADALLSTGLSFRQAHHIVSKTIDLAVQRGLDTADITTELVRQASSVPIKIDDAFVQKALDPQEFVARRTTFGGSAAETVHIALEQAGQKLAQAGAWREQQQDNLWAAQQKLEQASQSADFSRPQQSNTRR